MSKKKYINNSPRAIGNSFHPSVAEVFTFKGAALSLKSPKVA